MELRIVVHFMADKSDFDIASWLLPILFKNFYVHTFAYYG